MTQADEVQVRYPRAHMKRYLAEFIRTFVLVFGTCGSAVLAGEKIGNAGIAVTFEQALLDMARVIKELFDLKRHRVQFRPSALVRNQFG